MSELQDYIQRRSARDPEFAVEYDKRRPVVAFQAALMIARDNAGLTQAELADRMGVSQAVIGRLESGDRMPKLDTLIRLAEALDVQFLISSNALIELAPTERAVELTALD